MFVEVIVMVPGSTATTVRAVVLFKAGVSGYSDSRT
jgi:hypothetical protein